MSPIARRPFFSDDTSYSNKQSLVRAITASALAAREHGDAHRILRSAWPDDNRAQMILRAAVTPTSTADFPTFDPVTAFRSIAPASAAFALFDRGLKLDLTGLHSIKIPHVAALPTVPVFVAENAPAPTVQFTNAGTTVGPVKKILVLSAVTRELDEATPNTASGVIGRIPADASNKSIDAQVFSTNAATAAAPAGAFWNVTPITATSGGGSAAAIADRRNLIQAIGDAGIDVTDAVFVCQAGEAQFLEDNLLRNRPILISNGIPPKTLAWFAPAAIASGYQGVPEIETRKEAAFHFESSNPLEIVSSPGVVAAPTKSMFQVDAIAIKVRANAAFACLPGGAQLVQNVSW
jgi:hypothetical protein